VLLDYQQGRGQVHPQTFLGNYSGILVTDGYTAWRTLHGATHVGCMAHSRRRFVEALKTRKNGLMDRCLAVLIARKRERKADHLRLAAELG
jgi:hypothetical protein